MYRICYMNIMNLLTSNKIFLNYYKIGKLIHKLLNIIVEYN